MNEANNIVWSFLGKPLSQDSRRYYKHAEVRYQADNSTRIFKIGECVYMSSDDFGGFWVGQIVQMYERAREEQDVDPVQRMRIVLRWMYDLEDISRDSRRAMHPSFFKRSTNELMFSDGLEFRGNSIEVIQGRAFLFQNVEEKNSFHIPKEHSPSDLYWPGDKLHIVRYFYGNQSGVPPPVRELEKNELNMLLRNPTTEKMYKRSRSVRRGFEPAIKGVGRKVPYHTDIAQNC